MAAAAAAAVGSVEYDGASVCGPQPSAHGDYGGPPLTGAGPPTMEASSSSPQVSYGTDPSGGPSTGPAAAAASLTALGFTPPAARNRPPTGEEVVCGVCGKVLCNKYVLKTHLRDMHGPRQSHQCPVCHRMYASLNSLRAHMSGTHKKPQQHPPLRY